MNSAKQTEPKDVNSKSEKSTPIQAKAPAFSRRSFLRAAGVTAVSVAGAGALNGCDSAPAETPAPVAAPPSGTPVPAVDPYTTVPGPPAVPASPGWRFFSLQEAQTVEALTARLLPGTPDDPGAREAGVVYYIDTLLSNGDGFVEATYRQPPYVQTYAGDTPPTTGQSDPYQVIWVPEAEIERYGYQSIFTPRETFRMGIAAVDRYARQQFDKNFTALSEDEQDQIVTALVEGKATGFDPLLPAAFFQVVRRYTAEGMFSDPAYGGNRNMVGWQLIGYPGAQRAYTPDDIRTEGSGLQRPIWSLADLPQFHAGIQAGGHAILPVSGSDEHQ